MSLEILDLLLVIREPGLHVTRDVIDIEGSITIAQDFLGTVIARNDYITIAGVKDVINSTVQHLGVHLGMGKFHLTGDGCPQGSIISLLLNELLGLCLSRPHIDR